MQELDNIDFSRGISRHCFEKALVTAVESAFKNDFIAEQAVVQRHLCGHHAGEILRRPIRRVENVLFKFVNEFSRLFRITIHNSVWRQNTSFFDDNRANFQPVEYAENAQGLVLILFSLFFSLRILIYTVF